jgi:hypothetical protein
MTVNVAWLVAYLGAAAFLALITFVVPGVKSIAIGKDKRVSTSKLQVLMWTYVVVFALLALFFGYVISELAQAFDWKSADTLKMGLGDAFANFTKKGLDQSYLLLLGLPLGAAVTARAITTSKLASGTIVKSDKGQGGTPETNAVQEAVSDDNGNTDLGDFQYFLFNVLAILYFSVQFLSHPAKGLPDMPDTLVGLTGIAAAAYIAKKGVYRDPPILFSVSPPEAAPGDRVDIYGARLLSPPQDPAGGAAPTPTRVLFGLSPAAPLSDPTPAEDHLIVEVPPRLQPGPTTVRVVRPPGAESGEFPFEVVDVRPTLIAVRPSRIVLGRDERIEIDGTGFLTADATEGTAKNGVTLDGRPLSVVGAWEAGRVVVALPTDPAGLATLGVTPGDVPLVVYDSRGRPSLPQQVRVEAQPPPDPTAQEPSGP